MNQETELTSFETRRRDAASGVRGDHQKTTEIARARSARTRTTPSGGNKRQRRRVGNHAPVPGETHTAETAGQRGGTPDSLDLFLRRARAHPLLTAADEVELAQRIER